MKLRSYERHIRNTCKDQEKKSVCGKDLVFGEWVFENIDHAYYNVLNKGRLMPCRNCTHKIVTEFLKELM